MSQSLVRPQEKSYIAADTHSSHGQQNVVQAVLLPTAYSRYSRGGETVFPDIRVLHATCHEQRQQSDGNGALAF